MGCWEQSRTLGDMLTLGRATLHSGERILSGLGLEGDQEHLASLDLGRSWRKGCHGFPGRRRGECPYGPDSTCSLAVIGRTQRSSTGTLPSSAGA